MSSDLLTQVRNGPWSDLQRQIEEGQWEEGLSMIADSVFRGFWGYNDFLATHPDAKAKEYVDDWLRGNLVGKDKDKIIPGFNDK